MTEQVTEPDRLGCWNQQTRNLWNHMKSSIKSTKGRKKVEDKDRKKE